MNSPESFNNEYSILKNSIKIYNETQNYNFQDGTSAASSNDIYTDRLLGLAYEVLQEEGVIETAPGPLYLAIWMVDDYYIAELNEEFMDNVGPTDVLSFPVDGRPPNTSRHADDSAPPANLISIDSTAPPTSHISIDSVDPPADSATTTPTDLSALFPSPPATGPVDRPLFLPKPSSYGDVVPWILGDIFICPHQAELNTIEHGLERDDEIALLLVHGILHILGMDHELDAEAEVMEALEQELLDKFWYTHPIPPHQAPPHQAPPHQAPPHQV